MPIPNPIAVTIGALEIRWYGILVALAMAAAIALLLFRAPKHKLSGNDLLDMIIIAIPCGIVGARLYYVLFHWDYYGIHPNQIINLRAGGLAIHGGLLLGVFAAMVVCRYKKIGVLNVLDLAAPCIALGQAIGRWGNYFNSEAHGGPTDLPWAITIDGQQVHPTFLYESLWCLLLCGLLLWMDGRRSFTGQIICLYGMLYSLERFFVEWLRTDSLMIGPFKQAQVISLLIFIVCLCGYLWLRRRQGDPATH